MSEEILIMTFEANTIQHLGVKMYSTIPPALAELIANAYDACATKVYIKLFDDKGVRKVIVEDDGTGMSFDQVNEYFLRIGRNRRDEEQKSSCGRIATGKKGLGKLALFGIGDVIQIVTQLGKELVHFEMNWNEILGWKDGSYRPKFNKQRTTENGHGTTITLTDLKRKTGFPLQEYAESIAKLFDFRDDFKIYISLNDGPATEIDNKSKYININPEFSWDIKNIINQNENSYHHKNEIDGQIITTEKPLKNNQRGITLFANGRMVNNPEFFGPSESSHFYSYATGWLNVDFIDNWEEDVISTNRQSIDWENEKTSELKIYLASCISIAERQWRDFRKEKKQENISKKADINIGNWLSTLPKEVQSQVETIINLLDNTPELSEEVQQKSIQLLHQIAPEYANLHWRNLESEIKEVAEKYYKTEDFYSAFIEALKRYITEVKKKSGITNILDRNLMQAVFNGRLLVTKKYKKTDGSDFDNLTIQNIEEAQKMLSEGIIVGGRNPLQHEQHLELSKTGLFSEKDCLDFLSLLSHLFKRLQDSEAP
jgi:uncharacterized protein (TIGR02391 family)